jgi:nitroreductase/NAD-dependent dihydropyrimidine dehydrogenase PreA subunit
MGIVAVDETKCKQDGICAAECPRRLIVLEGEEGFPVIEPENEANCMTCGHCVVVCPHGAMSISGVPIQDCPEIENDLQLSWDQVEQFLRSRRSIRVYKDKVVERQTMQKLIDMARYAPTASNAQNVHWLVINDWDQLKEFSRQTIEWMRRVIEAQPDSPPAAYFRPVVAGWDAEYDGILRNAPTLVVASAPSTNLNGLVDCSIALSYLELAAMPLGLGTCWAGLLRGAMLNTPQMPKSMGLPKDHTWYYPMMIGYPKFKYHRLPERKQPLITWK